MPLPPHEIMIAPLMELRDDHDCPYAERVLTVDALREYGMTAHHLLALMEEVSKLHDEGVCPPTHIQKSPTKEWSDLVRATRHN